MDESPLVNKNNLVNGAVDYKNRPVLRSKSGCWRSSYFIIGVEVAERFAYYGVSSNLIMYLTGPLGQSTATAAENVNVWSGTASLLPLVGAFIADAFLGRYVTILIASLLYILALGLLAFSTLLPSNCENAVGGHKPCVQAFGADQFDADNPEERKAKSSFFNWWYFGLCAGSTIGIFVLSYIQDNLSWGLGFGIPCIIMGFALIIFLSGTMTYRFGEKTEDKSALFRISRVFVKAARNRRTTPSEISAHEQACGTLHHQDSQEFRFLNKALLSPDGSNEDATVCSIDEVEEAKAVLRLIPVWASLLGYGIVFAQISTLFTKQGATLDKSIRPSFDIPAAALQSFIGLTIVILIPIYDTILVPLTRSITKTPSGITMLQRMGTGIFISIVSMVVAAVVETKRLKTAREYGLVDDPNAMVPMKIWWLLPQYLLAGTGEVFTMVGMQEFFYDQMPSDLKSIGLALYLSVIGIAKCLKSVADSKFELTHQLSCLLHDGGQANGGSQNNKFDSKLENGGVVYKVFDDMPKQNFGVVYKVNEEMPHGNISSVKDYYDTFYSIYTDSQLSPEHGLSCFLDGLKEEIQGMVRLFKPQTLREAYYLAKIHELTLNKTKPKDPTRTVKLPTPSIQKFKNPEELHKSANFHAINTKFQAYLQSHAHKRIRSEEMLNAEISITLMENNDENNVGSTMGINTKDLEDIQEVECSEENEELELESEAQTPFQYEENLYHKFGTSWDPILERQVVMESKETIEFEKIWLEVFIKAGMGGYTGNVSASRVGEIAKEAGILKDIKELELNDVKEHGMVVEASLIKDKILRQPSSNFIVVSETFEWKPGLKSCSFERWRKIQHDLNEHGVVHMLRTRSLMLRAELHLKCDYGSLKWRYLGRKFKSSRRLQSVI
nr:protein NRT1/ PTR FAMILY 5.10-like [Tanacetum cinerariifolium]